MRNLWIIGGLITALLIVLAVAIYTSNDKEQVSTPPTSTDTTTVTESPEGTTEPPQDPPAATEETVKVNPNSIEFADVAYVGDKIPDFSFATKVVQPGEYVTNGSVNGTPCVLQRVKGGDIGEVISEVTVTGPGKFTANSGDYIYSDIDPDSGCVWELVK